MYVCLFRCCEMCKPDDPQTCTPGANNTLYVIKNNFKKGTTTTKPNSTSPSFFQDQLGLETLRSGADNPVESHLPSLQPHTLTPHSFSPFLDTMSLLSWLSLRITILSAGYAFFCLLNSYSSFRTQDEHYLSWLPLVELVPPQPLVLKTLHGFTSTILWLFLFLEGSRGRGRGWPLFTL